MNIVILAAGLGKRMYSHLPKVLQPVGGKALLKHVVEAARRLPDAGKIIVVVGHGSEEVKEAMADQPVTFVLQKEQKGTGHAVQQALEDQSRRTDAHSLRRCAADFYGNAFGT